MNNQDPALTCSNPRLIAAIYFGLLSVVGTMITDALLSYLGIKDVIPLFKALILGMVVASCTGALCGELIVHCVKPFLLKTFLIGFFMVIGSLPVYDLGLVYFIKEEQINFLSLVQMQSVVYFYLVILAYSYAIFGIILAVGSGLAAMYLRAQLVYDLLATYESDTGIKELPDSPVEKNRIQHSDQVSIKHK